MIKRSLLTINILISGLRTMTCKVSVLLVVVAVCSCGKDSGSSTPAPEPNPKPQPPFLTEECPNGTVLTYENFGRHFLLNHCTTCHSKVRFDEERVGAPEKINLDHPDDIDIWRQRMIATLRSNADTPMPPSRSIPNAQRVLAMEWLSCGAPGGDEY